MVESTLDMDLVPAVELTLEVPRQMSWCWSWGGRGWEIRFRPRFRSWSHTTLNRNHVAFGAQQSTVYAALPTLRWGVANRDGFSAQKEFNASVEAQKTRRRWWGNSLARVMRSNAARRFGIWGHFSPRWEHPPQDEEEMFCEIKETNDLSFQGVSGEQTRAPQGPTAFEEQRKGQNIQLRSSCRRY